MPFRLVVFRPRREPSSYDIMRVHLFGRAFVNLLEVGDQQDGKLQAMTKMWMVRGDSGRLYEQFRDQKVVSLGWGELAHVAKPGISRDKLAHEFASRRPDLKPGSVLAGASQVWRYINKVEKGDKVLTFDPSTRRYLVGTIEGDLTVDQNPAQPGMTLLRKTRWEHEISRDDLGISTKNSLGSAMTFFQVPPSAAAEILRIGSSRPDSEESMRSTLERSDDESGEEAEDLLQDLEVRAVEFIKDSVSKLDWDEMQELLAGILRAMGYKTRVAPRGPDRGADIFASPDGLGFENPRIIVEVKHRSGPMGSKEVRSFLGGRHKDDRGLYVSTGGFSKDARYEADRASIPVTLWELDDVVRALMDYYETIDSETRRLVPLKRLYWPA